MYKLWILLSHTHLICIWTLLSAPPPDGRPQQAPPSTGGGTFPFVHPSPLPYDHNIWFHRAPHTTWTLNSFPVFAVFAWPLTGSSNGRRKLAQESRGRILTSRSDGTEDQEVIWADGDGAVDQPQNQTLARYQVEVISLVNLMQQSLEAIFQQKPNKKGEIAKVRRRPLNKPTSLSKDAFALIHFIAQSTPNINCI